MTPKQLRSQYQAGLLSIEEVRKKLALIENNPDKNRLSQGQEGLWALQKLYPEISAYNCPMVLRFFQKIDFNLFEKACSLLVQQYPILQTVIREKDGRVYQTIEPSDPISITKEDLSHLESDQINLWLRDKAKEPFSFEKGSLFRIHLVQNSEKETLVLLTVHHLIFDGGSVFSLLNTLTTCYRELLKGGIPAPRPFAKSFQDFVVAEKEMIESKEGERRLSYWREELKGPFTTLEFPTDFPRLPEKSFEGTTFRHIIDAEFASQIKQFSKENSVYLSTLFLSVFQLLLFRYTGQEEIIVGMPFDQRDQAEYEAQIGFFINMIPIRCSFARETSFFSFLKKLQLTIIEGIAHSYPFPRLLRELQIPLNSAFSPVFQVEYIYQNFSGSTKLQQLSSRHSDLFSYENSGVISQEGEYEMTLEVFEGEADFMLNLKYDPNLYKESTISRFLEHFCILLKKILQTPEVPHTKFSFLSETEEKKLLSGWNNTEADYPEDRCIHELFEQQAQKTPKSIALVFEGQTLTYEELNQKSTVLAGYLQQSGVKPDDLVAICVERSLEMVVGLLGILKAGAAYVPLDPEYPIERLSYMLKDSQTQIVMTQAKLEEKVHGLIKHATSSAIKSKIRIITLDKQWKEIQNAVTEQKELKREVKSTDLIYVMYTSGSTGKPKGVMLEHRAICNRITWMQKEYNLQSEDRVLQKTPFSFDVSGWEFYWPLIVGATLVILQPEKHKDPEFLRDIIQKERITILHFVPSMLQAFLATDNIKKCQSIRKVFCSGEALTLNQIRLFFKKFVNQELHNLYGPTEAAIDVTYWKCDKKADHVSIGKPISNIKMYILDTLQQIVPVGIPGELYISGDGLARGYLNNPDLTEDTFVKNPFDPGTKLYKTGDLARWLPDGTIEYLGRVDHQVKLRGFRIELGEIESVLDSLPEVEQSVVVLQEEPVERLIAYYVPLSTGKENGNISKKLTAYAQKKLPEYMVPSFCLPITRIPLTPNGKIDRKYLKQKKIEITTRPGHHNTALSISITETDEIILKLWQEVLQVEGIGIHDGFFEVGGNSILAITLAKKIQERFQCEFLPAALFKYNAVRAISLYILENNNKQNVGPAPVLTTQPEKKEQDSNYPAYYQDSLAIIGISCHFPGASDHWQFWENLKEGKESVQFFSKEELQNVSVPQHIIDNPNYVPILAGIEGKDLFDPGFFNISPKNAVMMPPQMRLLLLHAWQAIEDAGYVNDQIPKTSVFVSAGNQFHRFLSQDNSVSEKEKQPSDDYVAWMLAQEGTIPAMISYQLGLQGQCAFIHSNCSSSLNALYSAYQSLQSKEANYALVGAASFFTGSNIGYVHQPGLTLSSDGHCRAFDAKADGMIGGEGVGAILLKRATDAVEDGDHIYALLRGIGVNNDGSDKAGFYAPSVNGQSSVIQQVLKKTRIHPESIGYVEAHGTGTALGDPIELMAISEAYQKHTADKQFCGIGSVKPNIGHLDTVAGLAGCIKTALSLYFGEIPPSINYTHPNPQINFENSPFYVNDRLKPWPQESSPRRAALSSFGIGGTNTHAILEEHKTESKEDFQNRFFEKEGPFLIPLSAKKEENLKEYAKKFIAFIESRHSQSEEQEKKLLERLAYTLQTGRKAMEHRVIFLIHNSQEFVTKLRAFIKGNKEESCFAGTFRSQQADIELLEEDEDAKTLIRQWIQKGKLKKLARLWVNGTNVDWKLLYNKGTPTRMSLPTYPFSKECCIKNPAEASVAMQQTASPVSAFPALPRQHTSKKPFEMMTFEEVWQEQPLPDQDANEAETVICFLSDEKNQNTVVNEMSTIHPGARIVFISQNTVFKQQSAHNYSVSKTDQRTYVEAFKQVQKECNGVDAVLYLWALEDSSCIQDSSAIVYILQAMAKTGFKTKRFILAGEYESGLDGCHLESWLGFGRSLGLILPHMRMVAVLKDAIGKRKDAGIKDWIQILLAELKTTEIKSVLYKKDRRHISRIQPTKMEKGDDLSIKPNGTYLITGGLGGFGFLFAEHFAKKHPINIILTGRSPLDEEKRSKIEILETLGSRVVYIQADICDRTSMEEKLSRVRERFGSINGVMHTAGFEEPGTLLEKDKISFNRGLGPKITGTQVLDWILDGDPLDFICYFSSSSVFTGDFGGCDYAVGNRFQMAYGRYRNRLLREGQRQGKAIVINWPILGKIGMAAGNEEALKLYLEPTGQRFLEPEEAVSMFDQLLTQKLTQHWVIVGRSGQVNRFLNLLRDSYFPLPESSPLSDKNRKKNTPPPIVFMLSGQGAQYIEMGRDLYRQEPNFKSSFDQMLNCAEALTGENLKSVLLSNGDVKKTDTMVSGIDTTQLSLLGVEYALARLLMKGGIVPYAMIGYSFGEYIAACLAGVFSLEEAVELVIFRSRLFERSAEGSMLSIPCPSEEIRPFLGPDVYLAVDNGISCVVSGKPEALEDLQNALKKKRYFCVPVEVSYAVHSGLMEPIISEFEAKLDQFTLNPPQIPFVSNFTGTWITDEQATDKTYWSNHLKNTVLFADGINTLLQDNNDSIFVEIGPGRDLSLLVQRYMGQNAEKRIVDTLRPAHQKVSDTDYLAKRIEKLTSLGVDVDRTAFKRLSKIEATNPVSSDSCTTVPVSRSDGNIKTKPGKGRRIELKGLSLAQCVEWELKGYVSQLLWIERDKFDLETHLADLGFDSIVLGEFAALLSEHYKIDFTPATFFAYPTLKKLTGYFVSSHKQMLEAFYQDDITAKAAADDRPVVKTKPHRPSPKRSCLAEKSQVQNGFEPIAIIGMSGRFPQARNIDELWQILLEGREAVEETPLDRFDWRSISESENISFRCGCVPGVDEFESLFFNISPLEAENMDPRQRLLLQESWNALEDAGYGKTHIENKTIGVFVGIEQGDYQTLIGDRGTVTSNHEGVAAARLSYFLNLSGPVLAINTACSSGMAAAHQACLSLHAQECDTAIAAGVNMFLTPLPFVGLNRAGMLSPDGRCYTFDKRANGMVPGEAVAALVFKRLSQARADGDIIQAVIRGSGINYDGNSNGITAPSGIAQTNLLKSVYDRCRVNPEKIEYIVTHGTGTKLGDPIEINALYDAFKGYTQKRGFCALTSTKPNLGHTFSPSGLISLISLVQSFHHETIPASLNCTEENDYIIWKESPFFVNKTTRSWPKSEERRRLGAVSGFGMSGTNIHMVVEDYPDSRDDVSISAPYYLLPLSAKTEAALNEKIKALIDVFQRGTYEASDLPGISYTLFEGRYHFTYRCAVVVQDMDDAMYVLKQVANREKVPNLFLGKVNRNFTEQKAMQTYINDLLHQNIALVDDTKRYKENLYALADFYCQGYDISWQTIYGEVKQSRLKLPTYPFARERHWTTETSSKSVSGISTTSAGAAAIHPLLHRNTSDLTEQRFSSTFSGEEFFLNHHRINGEKVLPGVSYLEMARVAVEKAIGRMPEETQLQLKNVVWSRPIVVNAHAKEVHIGLYGENNGQIQFEIYTNSEDSEEVNVHSQGMAELKAKEESPTFDINALKAQMKQGIVSKDACYQTFKSMGMDYGSGHRGISEIYRGENQLLAKLALPSSIQQSQNEYVLHPSLMDAALQSIIGLTLDSFSPADGTAEESDKTSGPKPSLPFALESLEVLSSCTQEMYAWIRYTAESKTTDKVQKLDIDLYDKEGNICSKLKGLSARVLEGEIGTLKAKELPVGTLLTTPTWKEAPIQTGITPQKYTEHQILLCDVGYIKANELETLVPGSLCLESGAKNETSFDSQFSENAVGCFKIIREILTRKPQGNVLFQILVPDTGKQSLFAGLSGLLKTAALENPQITGQLIQIDHQESIKSLAKKLQENRNASFEPVIKYEQDKRFVKTWKESKNLEKNPESVFKKDGVYLITGGLGGLGMIFAKEILNQAQEAKIILTGRSELSDRKKTVLKELQSENACVDYQKVDVSDLEQVKCLIKSIQSSFGKLNGIIHSAGVILDNFIIKKSTEEFRQVLAPKVSGTINLDETTKDLNLDFFVLFSSGAGASGNIGQSDYAVANAFMDHFAHYRNQQVLSNKRTGQTLSINWHLWKEGGMQVDESTEEIVRRSTGMVAMETDTGLKAFYHGLASKQGQLMVMVGDIERIQSHLFMDIAEQKPITSQVDTKAVLESTDMEPSMFQEKATDLIKRLLASTLKLPANRIHTDEPLEKYGINSLLALDMTNQLEKSFGSLPKTLFFEYQTIDELTSYFINSYREELLGFLNPEESSSTKTETNKSPISREALSTRNTGRSRFVSLNKDPVKPAKSRHSDIAIIGISGRYPQAENLEEFWINLRDGKDCITEVPIDRWDWRQYYTEDRSQPGFHFSKWGGFIDGVDEFDPLFFNISPREAIYIDPQERLFLEHAWMAIEDAGYTRDTLHTDTGGEDLPGQVGVYAGVMYGEYQLFGAEESLQGNRIGMDSSYASVANRVSYIMDLHGPSMSVDTMCSSSLTAIHLACQDLKLERTDLCIAGGVNVTIHPNKYLMLSAGQLISTRGRCESFGDKGEGFIPGEGVGVILLKRLADAQRDNDRIYGVIKGSAVNHGGKTNGYSVPNPNAQQKMIERAFNDADIDPGMVSYVEAHGTGTRLGDPIEITALTKAFRKNTEENGFCLIGSAKSNIGHCESAAGVAGVTKVLLQMRHQKIVPSLHSTTLNPHIDFEKSPFIVNQTLQDWSRPVIQGKEIPRIAGISSFGAGGANAHIIIEEYPNNSDDVSILTATQMDRVIIPLSAKNRDRLEKVADNLLTFIRKTTSAELANHHGLNLADLSYTLQVGREAMEERLGLIVGSLKELEEKLSAFLEGKDDIEDVHLGQVKRNKDNISLYTADEDMQNTINAWIAKGKHTRLLELWVKGLDLDWNKLYGDIKPKRISLPTYPFAKERYWIIDTESKSVSGLSNASVGASVIHPLLHQNTSDLTEQRFSSTFSGKEFFLNDHRINGKKVFPGVGYLEMARAAVEKAIGRMANGTSLQFKNIVWSRPIIVNGSATDVHIGLFGQANGQIQYEIYTESENEEENIVHSQGMAELKEKEKTPPLDIGELRSQMQQGVLTNEICYETFKTMGLDYGSGHRGISKIYRGENQLLAELNLPASIQESQNEYVLHPGLMDAALQSSIGLTLDSSSQANGITVESGKAFEPEPSLPFALESLEVLNSCTREMYAWVRYSIHSKTTDKIQKLDIDLYDKEGNVCSKLRGLSARTVDGEVGTFDKPIGTLLTTPSWKEAPIPTGITTQEYAEHRILLCETGNIKANELESLISGSICLKLLSKKESFESRFSENAVNCFQIIKEILKKKPKGKVLIQVLVPSSGEQSLFTGFSGLLKTATLENPDIIGQLFQIDPQEDIKRVAEILEENKHIPFESVIRYQKGKRLVKTWEDSKELNETPGFAFKEDGVYLITGGLGGLGILFAKEILCRTQKAKIILTGRSTLSAQKEAILKELQTETGRVDYQNVNVSDLKQVASLIKSIQSSLGTLDGIIHSAGVISDNFIIKKSIGEFKQVLAPKVLGAMNLDEATKDLELDFFVLFSSGAGVFGNIGQADYATANAFMDHFAHYRNQRVLSNERTGQTLSLNWPLWKEGGMQIDTSTEEMMWRSTGMVAMKTETGIQAFYHGLASKQEQIMVMVGDIGRLRAHLSEDISSRKPTVTQADSKAVLESATTDPSMFKDKATDLIKRLLASTLKLPVHRIHTDEPMEKYGINSILALDMINQLEKTFGSLSKTLFFEYQTIDELTRYFMDSYKEELYKFLNLEESSVAETQSIINQHPISPKTSPKPNRGRNRFVSFNKDVAKPVLSRSLDIAIIGISGRYPQAENLEEFWTNLRDGRDCITEVPIDRWDWRQYYTEDRSQTGSHFSKWGGFIKGVDEFDSLFFNISPRQAVFIDPQERLFLEHVWMAVEDAGYTRETLRKDKGEPDNKEEKLPAQIGVYAGVMYGEYQLFGVEESMKGNRIGVGSSYASVANRVSYIMNLHGPSMTVDTMCSSSLTAIHLACQDLILERTNLGIAGGVNVTIHPNKYLLLSADQFISTRGHCESFGEGGEGYIPGEGVGVVLLKRLVNAQRDGDQIYGVIKGSAVNHGGKTNGYSVPNPNAQQKMIEQAFSDANIDPGTVSYIEAHGTGTRLGDPIEITALTKAFRKSTEKNGFCLIGSAKSNIGHCESAAGIAGLTKVLLQMRHKQIVPSLHSTTLNPHINFEETPFIVNQTLRDWSRPVIQGREVPRIAGISSFGAGGANAHLIVEEYQDNPKDVIAFDVTRTNRVIIPLSAKNQDRLKEGVDNLLTFIRKATSAEPADNHELNLADLSYTLQVGREAMEERLGLIVSSIKELEEKLAEFLEGKDDIKDLFQGQVKHNKDSISVFAVDEDLQKAIDTWITKGKHSKLLDMWVKGLVLDWDKLYGDIKPRRVSLPTYPFAKARHWIGRSNVQSSGISSSETKVISPKINSEPATGKTITGNKKMEKTPPKTPYLHRDEEHSSLDLITNLTCGERQKDFINNFIAKYEARTKKSKDAAIKNRGNFADPRTAVYFNPILKEIHYPITYDTASGAYLYDIDGNKYIDISGDFGVNLFGHNPVFLSVALINQIGKGNALSGRYDSAGKAAQLFCEMTGHDRVYFSQSGTESLMSAARLARAFSGKSKVAMFQGSYHGHFDGFLGTNFPGVTDSLTQDTLVLKYGEPESLDSIADVSSELAAVIVEPVQSADIELQPREFLQSLRQLTIQKEIILIFDEMITGFRVHPRGCQGLFDVKADLAAYGKILGGGITAGAVGGKEEIMRWADGGNWLYGDQSRPKPTTFFGGTHTQNPLKMAGTLAVLQELKKKSPDLQMKLTQKTEFLVEKINRYAKNNQLPARVVNFGSQFKFKFFLKQFNLTQALFLHLLNNQGIRYNLHGNCFLTTAHSDHDIQQIIDGVINCFRILLNEGFFYKSTDKATTTPTKSISSTPGTKITSNKTTDSRPIDNRVTQSNKKTAIEKELENLIKQDSHHLPHGTADVSSTTINHSQTLSLEEQVKLDLSEFIHSLGEIQHD